jgi:predicted ATPase
MIEKLSPRDKNILRTASIIGNRFSKQLLYGVLSPKMRKIVFESLISLVTSR